jgi:hypothetical protein
MRPALTARRRSGERNRRVARGGERALIAATGVRTDVDGPERADLGTGTCLCGSNSAPGYASTRH